MLVHAAGTATLGEVASKLAPEGLTLGLGHDAPPLETTIDAWIAGGARGAPDPWEDPVDHLVAGFTARIGANDLVVRPAPRRAVGPDLFALFLGTRGAVGAITSAHLRAHGHARPRVLPAELERDPAPTEAERGWLDRIVGAASSVR
jgi:alkyldihydroxyacetonephosphate synthase